MRYLVMYFYISILYEGGGNNKHKMCRDIPNFIGDLSL